MPAHIMTILRLGRRLLAIALLGIGAAAFAAKPIPLRLIGINDFHGNLESTGLSLTLYDPQDGGETLRVPTGGAAAVAGFVNALRAGASNSLMIAGGDLIGAAPLISTLFRHESTIEVMNAIGLDVSTVGNHEFDAGAAELKRIASGGCGANSPDSVTTSCTLDRYQGARFDYLSANVIDRPGHTLFPPYVIKRVHGIRVGVIGAVTKTTPSIVRPSGVAGLRFIDEADGVNRAARMLKARGVKVIVATFHEGGELGTPLHRGDWNDTRCPDAHGRIFEIAKRLSRDVDVIFSAHTHQGYRCIVDGRVIIQGTSYGRGISVVDLTLDAHTGKVVPALTRSINLPVMNEATDPALRERFAAALPADYAAVLRTARPDPAIAQQVAGYAALAAPKSDREVGMISGRYGRSGSSTDSVAGRMVADAQLFATRAPDVGGAQIALTNEGGMRSDLECNGTPPCHVTFGQVFTMQPFGNSLVVMSLTGAQLKTLLESQQKVAAREPHFLQPSEGFSYTWRAGAAPGGRVQDMRLNGEAIVPERSYRVTVNNFLAEGGDGFTLLAQGTDTLGGGQDVDAVLDYLKAAPVREPSPQARITLAP
jgi:5'-nucleotidase